MTDGAGASRSAGRSPPTAVPVDAVQAEVCGSFSTRGSTCKASSRSNGDAATVDADGYWP